ncbi:MAG TPA: hypothetical protein PLC04_07880 [Candidatus Kapabacteria bacterium]|nr:hypothetical protein [Candidatus Kapabacteria bacterium]
MQNQKNKMNLRKHPLRGILTEIAQEKQVSVQNVYQQIFLRNNPEMLKIFNQKRKQREREYDKLRIR